MEVSDELSFTASARSKSPLVSALATLLRVSLPIASFSVAYMAVSLSGLPEMFRLVTREGARTHKYRRSVCRDGRM